MIEDVGYLDRLERLKLFPYTVDAIRLLNRAGYKVVVVTQPDRHRQRRHHRGVCEGGASTRSRACAEAGGGRIDGFYYCPHSTPAVVRASTGPTAIAANRSPV